MRYKIILLLLPAICVVKFSRAQLRDSLKAHIDTAFDIMQRSLYSDRVNWEAERIVAYATASSAKNKRELFPAIAKVYKKLDDHHGWFEQYDDKIRLPWKDTREASDAMKKEWAKGPKVIARMIGNIAYLRIPGMHVYSRQQIDQCANWLADSVRSLAAKKPKGWIIDLRLNTGGNIIPMMSGIASFFPEGILSYYLDKNNKALANSVIRNKIYVQDDTLKADLKNVLPGLSKEKVAVLIGRGTGSSGEGVAYNFMNRKKTKLLGENSAGVANATEGFVFNNDQSYFLITTSKLGNKNKKAAPETLKPDISVTLKDDFEKPENDDTVKAALAWLKK